MGYEQGIARTVPDPAEGHSDPIPATNRSPSRVASEVSQPSKLLRIASVARAMLEEARSASCDVQGCARLRAIYWRTIEELSEVLSADLMDELSHLVGPFETETVDPAEVRIAQAELVGWLEGLFSGLVAVATWREPPTVPGIGNTDPTPRPDETLPGMYL